MRLDSAITRRSVLKTTGGAVVGLGATGLASGAPDKRIEVNVGFRSDRGRAAALDAADDVVREFAFDALTIRVPEQALAGLRRRPDVRYVEENGRMHALAQTIPWGISRIDAPDAHSCGFTGEGAHVAIIDTGIDSGHPDLQANLGQGYAATSCSYWYGDCNYAWDDDNGHGTHCAGIVGAVDNTEGVLGVAPDATIHAVKALNYNGGGSYSDIADAIQYVADQGWDVANLSLGGGYSSAVHDAVQYATDHGVLIVGAAGNDGPCSDCISYPAAHSEVVAVTATDSSDYLSSFTSTGPEAELAAPGTDIYSTYTGGGYDTLSGTSMAAPHVSGTGALLMGDALDYSNHEARSRLCDTAENVGLGSNESGCGLVDAGDAVGC